MQSFKQFITEEKKITAILAFNFHIEYKFTDYKLATNELRNLFDQVLTLKASVDVSNINNEISIEIFSLTEAQYSNHQFLIDVREKIISFIQNDLGNKIDRQFSSTSLTINLLPEKTVEWETIVFRPKISDTVTLKNVHKLIKCEEFVIFNPYFIESNVLGLLELKNAEVFFRRDSGGTPWVKIVEHYLKNGGDVLECQEALIDAGLDKYANF